MTEPTIQELNTLVERYQNSPAQRSFSLNLSRVPACLRSMMELYLDPQKANLWLQDKEVFEGKSALDYLSELEATRLRGNVRAVVDPFYKVLAFTSGPQLPTEDEVVYAVREAQCAQLGLL